MRSDVERWEKKYQETNAIVSLKPDPLLVEYRGLLESEGLALDLAAGTCQASVHLAKLHNRVIAVDCSLTALQLAKLLNYVQKIHHLLILHLEF
mgnify:CR=1 FL=1